MNNRHLSGRLILTFTFLAASMFAQAIDIKFMVDGIFYKLEEGKTTVSVTFGTEDNVKYSGDVVIPPTVTYEGQTYDVTAISGWAFDRCDELTSVSIPEGVVSIGEWAFNSCTMLRSIKTPNSLEGIGPKVFSECTSLATVFFGSSLTGIDAEAFYNCTNLSDFYFLSLTPPSLGSRVFNRVKTEQITLHVPEASFDNWNISPWNGFKKIVALTEDDINTAIIDIQRDTQKADCYDLNGRRMTDAKKQNGIRITEGKAMLVK